MRFAYLKGVRGQFGQYGQGVKLMDSDRIKGKWNQIKGDVKRKWGQLTDDDLLQAEGNMDKLVGTIQQRAGEQRDAIASGLINRSTNPGLAVRESYQTPG
jgi:uncharacterized protein YjbJ (UPF0337 family)